MEEYLKHYIKAKSKKYRGEKSRQATANLDEHLPLSRRSLYSAINVVVLHYVAFSFPRADIWETRDFLGFEFFKMQFVGLRHAI